MRVPDYYLALYFCYHCYDSISVDSENVHWHWSDIVTWFEDTINSLLSAIRYPLSAINDNVVLVDESAI